MCNTVESLSLGLKILDLLRVHDEVTVSFVADRLNVQRSRAHRSLNTLLENEYVFRSDSSRGYVLGRKMLQQNMIQAMNARNRLEMRPVLQNIFEATGEAVHSSVLVGNELLVVDGRRSKYQHDIGLRVGMIAPAHSMAGGKILLSYLTNRQLMTLYPEESLARRGPKTITQRSHLIEELQKVRRSHYAFTIQESESGVNSVGMLLSGSSLHDRVAVVVSVPIERGSLKKLSRIQQQIRVILNEKVKGPGRLPMDEGLRL